MPQTVKTTTAKNTIFSTTLLQVTTPLTTSSVMPFKFMTTIPNDNGETTVIPTIINDESNLNITEDSTEASNLVPTLSASKEALILDEQEPKLNEIQTDLQKESPIAIPLILLPPTRSFSEGMQKKIDDPIKYTSSTKSFSEERENQKEVSRENKPDPAHMMLLSRKDPVSWA